ncbi:hypothetical protein LDENG_00110400, partial [Lucifuga dentata]
MFTTYIKSLNDMVFSTSQSPEEPPSPGVLGRIGSWLSPWRGRGPASPTENVFPAGDEAHGSEEGEEIQESVSPQTSEQQEEKDLSSSPNQEEEEEDATQSAHRDGPVVSSEPEEGGPTEEEFVESGGERVRLGREREESSSGTSESGNPVSDKNASCLTHLPSCSEEGVVRDSDQAHAQPQAQKPEQVQTGKRLHFYLEETSVILPGGDQCDSGKDNCAGQEVIRTKVTKSLPVVPKANLKSSQSLDLPNNPSSEGSESKQADARPAAGVLSYYSTLEGVLLKSRIKPERDTEQAETDSMGRKNAAKRKSRKNSQENGGSSSQESTPSNAQPVSEGFPMQKNSMTGPQGKSPMTHKGESAANSSSEHISTPQTSPEGEKSKSDTLTVKQVDNLQDSKPATLPTAACVVDGNTEMDRDDDVYKVERKTETPESKRRSIKVSRSEVKLFAKNVPLNADRSKGGDKLKNAKDEAKDQTKSEINARLQGLKKPDEETKPIAGQIADKISLFECEAVGSKKKFFQTPRSADVSPARKPNERLKAGAGLSDLRSKSAERYDKARSSSASPVRGGLMTIKERARHFADACKTDGRTVPSQKPVVTGMSQKSPTSATAAATKSPELDKLRSKEQAQTIIPSEITSEPDERDTAAVKMNISAPKQQPADSKTTGTEASKTADQGPKSNSVKADIPVKGDSSDLTGDISPQSKGPGRTGSRSKRRKSKEPSSPLSPKSENIPEQTTSNQEAAASQQEMTKDTEKTVSASTQLTETDSLPPHKPQRITSDKQPPSDVKQQEVKEALEASDKPNEQLDLPIKKENTEKPVNGTGGLSEPSVSEGDKPDMVCSGNTKKPADKGSIIVSHKEERAGGQSRLFTEEEENDSKESQTTAAPSPSPSPPAQHLIEKTPTAEQRPAAEHPKLDSEVSRKSETENEGKVKQLNEKDAGQMLLPQNKDAQQINQTESKDEEKAPQSQKAEADKTSQTENKDEDKKQQLLPSDKHTAKAEALDSGQHHPGTQGTVAKDDEIKNAERKEETGLKDIATSDSSQAEAAGCSSEKTSGSTDFPAQMPPASQTGTSKPEEAAVCVLNHANDATNVTNSDKGPTEPLKGEKATNEQQSKPTESPETETQPAVSAAGPNSVSVEKTENEDDSHTHGANDSESSILKPIIKTTAAVEEVAGKSINDTPALIIDKMDEKESSVLSVKEHIPVSDSKSESNEAASQDAGNKSSISELAASQVKITLAPSEPQGEESKHVEIINDVASPKEKMTQSLTASTTAATSATDKVLGLPVVNGDLAPKPKSDAGNNKPSQAGKAAAAAKTTKPTPDSIQHSSLKKFNLPLNRGNSATQDAPSSWLDVDFPKQKLKPPEPKLSSSGSESNLLDTSGDLDDDFVERIKKLCAPFSLPPRKHNHLRPPQPPFAMPAIREDRFEKPFDPEEFKFGLRKNKFTTESTPGLLAKLQNTEPKAGLKPARASLADRSMLLNSMDVLSRLREKDPIKLEETKETEEKKDEQIKMKSRLEGSCVLSSLSTSSFRGKRNGVQAEADSGSSEDGSPTDGPQLSP